MFIILKWAEHEGLSAEDCHHPVNAWHSLEIPIKFQSGKYAQKMPVEQLIRSVHKIG